MIRGKVMNKDHIIVLGLGLVVYFHPTLAYAYLDPGTVGILIQGLIAAVMGAIVTWKLWFQSLLNFLRLKKKTQKTENADDT